MVLSKMIVSMAIITVFFQDMGLSQAQIGVTQAIFTLSVLAFDIPFGKLADNTNRKLINALGDFICAGAFVIYAVAQSFWMIVISESLLALGIAASAGTDGSLMRGYCTRFGRDIAKEKPKVYMIALLASAGAMMAGGVLGSRVDIRAPFWADVILFGICVVLSLFVRDYSPLMPKKVKTGALLRHALRDNRRLSARITALAPVREATHAIVWLSTPVLQATGVPLWLVGSGWLVTALSGIPGAELAKRTTARATHHRLMLPTGLCILGMAFCVVPNVFAVFTGLALLGVASGFTGASTDPIIAAACDSSIQTTIASIYSTVSRTLYVLAVLLVNWVAGLAGTAVAYATNAALFAILCGTGIWRLRKHP